MTISANFPQIAPSLDLDFANSVALDPRISYSRSTTGTYYDGQTSVLAEQNLALQSNTFTTNWTRNGITSVTQGVTDPFAGSNGWTFLSASGNSTHGVYSGALAQGNLGTFTFSAYLQAGTNNFASINVSTSGSDYINATFNLTSGSGAFSQQVTSGGYTYISNSITGIGSTSWYRCSVTFSNSVIISQLKFQINNSATPTVGSYGDQTWNAVGTETILVYGAQLEQHTGAGVYTPTTTATLTNYIPQLLTAPVNQPRFDFNPVTRQSLGLLMEQQSTNILTYSSDYTNAAWSKTNATVTSAYTISPDGTLNAQLLTATTAGGHIDNYHAMVSGTTYTFSLYAKSVTSDNLYFTMGNVRSGPTFTFSTASWSTVANWTTTVQAVGNGWYRISASTASNSTQNNTMQIGIATINQSIAIYGAQSEALAFPTSYIPTVASQVTRAQDFATMTGTNFSSWFNNQQGTAYCSFDSATIGATNSCVWGIDNNPSGGTALGYAVQRQTAAVSNWQNLVSITTGSISAIPTGSLYTTTQQTSYSYNNISGSFTLAGTLNTGTAATTTSVTVPPFSPTQLTFARYGATFNIMTGHIRKFAYYPIATTATQLQSLTGS